MKAQSLDCRWKFRKAQLCPDSGDVMTAAWETNCGQWCTESESAPHADGCRNGFNFCPYCGGPLQLELEQQVAGCTFA